MIGPFALVCFDMAGTTVRDDGAVESAFEAALASVGVEPGGAAFARAQEVVRTTMGWSKADVFARLLDPGSAARATEAFATAYEAVVAAGQVGETPGAGAVIRELRARGVLVCLTTGFAPSTRDALIGALGWSTEIDLALSPADVGRGARPPTWCSGPWPASGCPIRPAWPWWATRSVISRPGRRPVPVP